MKGTVIKLGQTSKKVPLGNGEAAHAWRCPNEEILSAYVDGNVTDRQRERIERHLAGCDSCRDEFGFLVKLQEEDETEAVPADWLVRARGLIEKGEPQRRQVWAWGTLAATASACALFLVSLYINPSQPENIPVAPQPPTVTSPQIVAQNSRAAVHNTVPSPVVRSQSRVELSPTIVFPTQDSIVTHEGLEFRWKEMKGALSYEARLLSSDGDMLWEQRMETFSAKLPATVILRPGETYYIWVRAYFAEGKVVQSKATRFTVADQN